MKKQKETISKKIGKSLEAQLISLAVGVCVQLILPKFLDAEQYASIQTYLLYAGFIGVFHFGLLDGILLRYSQYEYEELDKSRLCSQCRMLILICGGIALLGVVVCFFVPPTSRPVLLAVSASILVYNLFFYTSYTFQMTNRIAEYARLIIIYRVFYCIAVVILLLLGVRNFIWFCVADLAGNVVAILLSIPKSRQLFFGSSIPWKAAISEAKTNISIGSHLLFANLSVLFISGGARFVVQWFWPKAVFAKVAFAFTITTMFGSLILAISNALFPAMKRMDAFNFSALYGSIRQKMSIVLAAILLLYYPGRWILSLWLPSYRESLLYLGIFLPLIIFSSTINLLEVNYFKVSRNESTMFSLFLLTDVVAMAVYLGCFLLFSNVIFLLLGVVVSWVLCAFLMERKIYKMNGRGSYFPFIAEVILSVIFSFSSTQKNGGCYYLTAFVVYALVWYLRTRKASQQIEDYAMRREGHQVAGKEKNP